MKIFINTPFSSDANSFWRCMGPLTYLAKHSSDIDIALPSLNAQIHWENLTEFDMIFMHRPCRPQDLVLLQMARLLNIPVWSDYDDWLFHLPSWNPHQETYHKAETQQVMSTIIACSDIITVSTGALQERLSKINPNVIIIPNAYRSDLFSSFRKTIPDRKEIFMWRGTNTHDGDLMSVGDAFPKLSKPVHFRGSPPYFITSQMTKEKVIHIPNVDPILYWRHIYHDAPKVWLFPLKADFFNECKSNISWIEAMHAGAICVAPNLPEWRRPGVCCYEIDNAESFLDTAESAMSMSEDEVREHNQNGMDEVTQLFDIALINKIRQAVLRKTNTRDPFNNLTGLWALNTRDPFNNLTGLWALNTLKDSTEEIELDNEEKQCL